MEERRGAKAKLGARSGGFGCVLVIGMVLIVVIGSWTNKHTTQKCSEHAKKKREALRAPTRGVGRCTPRCGDAPPCALRERHQPYRWNR